LAETLIHPQQQPQLLSPNLTSTPDVLTSRHPDLAQKRLTKFRESMDRIPIEDYELPPSFRVFREAERTRPYLPEADRMAISKLWKKYWKLRRVEFSAQDYEKLMRILRHCTVGEDGASRILVLHKHMRSRGVELTSTMYEMVLQAHIILGTIQESIPIYQEATVTLQEGSAEHRAMLWTMLDTFVGNQKVAEGITFLDQLPMASSEDGSPPLCAHSLYRRLLLRSFGPNILSSSSPPPPHKPLGAILQFAQQPWIPQHNHVLRLLDFLETHPDGSESLPEFSKSCAGMLIKIGCVDSVTSLIQSLVLSGHLEEAARVLDLSHWHGMGVDVDQIRVHVLRPLDTQNVLKEDRKKNLIDIMDRWDTIAIRHSRPSVLDPCDQAILTAEYSRLVRDCIQGDDVQGALRAARYIHLRSWTPQEIDFRELCSSMVNHGRSSSYKTFLEVGYTLGGSVTFDLHTYRRLIYAACRRSDLFSALTLFQQVRTRHPDWTLDATFYNAIISTAGATGKLRVAERTFERLLEDGVQPDRYSFHGLLNAYAKKKDLEAALKIPEKMLKCNLNPTTRTFNLVLKAYMVARKDITTGRKLFRVMHLSGQAVPPDLVTFNQLLEGYRRAGNMVWFDAFFDQYFGVAKADEAQSADHGELELKDPIDQENDSLARERVKTEEMGIVQPKKSDNRTLLIQLRYSLGLPSVDLQTVQELWGMVEPKILPNPVPSSHASIAQPEKNNGDSGSPSVTLSNKDGSEYSSVAPSDNDNDNANANDGDIQPDSSQSKIARDALPPTHVPFGRWLGPAMLPTTDTDYFRFMTMTSFRFAFRSRGDVAGVKKMDQLLAELFPEHPLGEAICQRRMVKYNRIQTKKASKSQKRNTEP
jgi:pentatricopeptide repeat protein